MNSNGQLVASRKLQQEFPDTNETRLAIAEGRLRQLERRVAEMKRLAATYPHMHAHVLMRAFEESR